MNYAALIYHELLDFCSKQKWAKPSKPFINSPKLLTRIIYHALGITHNLPATSEQIEYTANMAVAAQLTPPQRTRATAPSVQPPADIRVTRAASKRPMPSSGIEDSDEPPRKKTSSRAILDKVPEIMKDVPAVPTEFQEFTRAGGAIGPSSTHQPVKPSRMKQTPRRERELLQEEDDGEDPKKDIDLPAFKHDVTEG